MLSLSLADLLLLLDQVGVELLELVFCPHIGQDQPFEVGSPFVLLRQLLAQLDDYAVPDCERCRFCQNQLLF